MKHSPFSRAYRMAGVAVSTAVLACVAGALTVHTEGADPGSVVRTRQGTVQGLTVGSVEQFRGIPYAAPPVGDLRWRAPGPPKPYAGGALQATSFPAPCVQGAAPAGFPAPSEDCLYLNLYRPAGSKEGKKMPVLMYLHGGGFNGGTASAIDCARP